jgi:membrane-bound serine protease (ClpP class)
MPITVDPNVVYLILLVSLWLSATAAYVPGTGIIELLAVLGVIASVVVLAGMPTNWLAVVAVVGGTLGFFIIPFLEHRFTRVALIGLAVQVLGSLTLFNGMSVSLSLIAVIVVASLLYYRFALLPVLESQRAESALIDDEPIIGMRGFVQRSLDPVGTVRVRGESWTARSDRPLDAGTEIVVVDREGLTLFVEAEKQKRRDTQETMEDMNHYGN